MSETAAFPALEKLMQRELERFREEHPRSAELSERAKRSLLGGVPMHWMVRWAGGFPVFATDAEGARFRDVDGLEYVDFCLGDTGAMTGHSPPATVHAVKEQVDRGITLMLPSEDALWVGEELARRFGLPYWQFALTATDANRFAIRLARAVTGRRKILVFNWCYHGTVDETFATVVDGQVREREGTLGAPVAPAETTRVVEFNDVEALERELGEEDVACVLAEPLTDEAFTRMVALGERFEAGVQRAIDDHSLPWHVVRLGCRVEYLFRPEPALTGAEAAAGGDEALDRFIHLYALNRGILLTPFHNMALMSPATVEADVDRHTEVFDAAARELTASA